MAEIEDGRVDVRRLLKLPRETRAAYEGMLDQFIDLLQAMIDDAESGKKVNWEKPWSPRGAVHANFSRPSRPYSALNQFMCDLYCIEHGWQSRFWITREKVDAVGGTLLPNQQPNILYGFYPTFVPQERENEATTGNAGDTTGDTGGVHDLEKGKIVYYIWEVPVYNLEQCTGIHPPKCRPVKVDVAAERIISKMPDKPTIIFEDIDQAFYHPKTDSIHLRSIEYFKSKAQYYDTLFHELAHSTGHQKRLNRETIAGGAYSRDHERAEEELVAEFAAAILSNTCGIATPRSFKGNIEYVKSWIKELREWKRKAPHKLGMYLSMAKQAADYIQGRKVSTSIRKAVKKPATAAAVELCLSRDPIFD
ncbi:MAG: zincin-like metallopeptidase domain-containing protein [Candidatus Sigynarchaeota archaeon]